MSQLMSVAGLENTMEIKNDELASYTEYLTPAVTTREKLASSGGAATRTNKDKLLQIGSFNLGDPQFSGVIVTSRAAADAMRADELWQVYGQVFSGDGTMKVNGFQLSDGSMVGTSVRGSYDIHVLPKGLGTWYNSPESVLGTCWMASRFYDAFSEEELISEVRNFYNAFYRIDLSDEQAEAMINGQ